MADVFVSYKAEDRRRVQPLVQALQADGLTVWWDAQIGGGTNWRRDIEEHLDAAKCVLVIWTKRSVGPEGEFVRDEAGQARRRGTYLPVRFDAVDLPLGFREVQAISLKGWTGNRSDQRYRAVLEAVRSIVSGISSFDHAHVATPVVNRRLAIGGGAAVVLGAAAGGWFMLRPKAALASNRIAVLPFANLSGDPAQAYFSDGIAEELRSSLSRAGMQVIGRASCDAVKNLDIKTAAAKLDVANILTGSVRRSPEMIRIDAQLVSGSDGVERWSEAYDRPAGDVLKVQTDIAENVAKSLSVALGQSGRAALTLGGTTDPAAQDLVLKVIHVSSDSEADAERKVSLLDAALTLDPSYAEAYARKAGVLNLEAGVYAHTADAERRGEAEALEVANRAIAIAPTMALGYAARAGVYQNQLQMGLALADTKRGLALPGENASVLVNSAIILAQAGQFEEALRLNARAIALDPLNPHPYSSQAQVLYFSRRYTEAETSARRSLQIASDQAIVRYYLGIALLAQGKVAEAAAVFREHDPSDYWLVGEAVIAARTGQHSQAMDRLRILESRFGNAAYYQYGQIYAQLGQNEEAFKELELAWGVRDPGLAHLRVDPFLDPLRRDPRVEALERKIGLS